MILILTWIINAFALLITTYLIPSIHIKSFGTALIVSMFLGLINIVIRPVLILFTLPITVITVGFFILVINALCFWIGAEILKGFDITGFFSAFFGSIFYSIISWGLSMIILG
ncbi:MAG: phage holin family protein [Burkholderia sp.]|nr:phage holin family protein [Burkholderia sp.]